MFFLEFRPTVAELLICLGVLKFNGDDIPASLDASKMSKIELEQISLFNKTHKKVRIGHMKDYTYRFKRDKNGILSNDGTYSDKKEVLNTKHTNEIRLCAGVTKVDLPGGKIEGRQAKPFNYSGKVILSQKDYAARMEQEIVITSPLSANNSALK